MCKPKWHWGSQLKLSSFNAVHKRQTEEARGRGVATGNEGATYNGK